MDMRSLPTQYTKVYETIDYDNIMYLYDYHPWNSGQNPKIDKITNTLLNLKNTEYKRRQPAVRFFFKVLTNRQITKLLDTSPKIFCVVPSHSENNVSAGLIELMGNIKETYCFENDENYLRRTRTVPKAANGGPRNQQLHIDSIEVTCPEKIENKTVYLFDDITTTGSSLLACKRLLLSAGAQRVVMVALGRTNDD
ncbi:MULTISPECIES: ComF family protein [unclassified Idiomarina]|uniref:ComF family protein n=2 Tax=Idiomarina TaxID=135575 RepID=UPI00257B4C1A|nr:MULTISPECIES: phosphoribosyltransferase [unclassified Idiomarina]|tara:strand:- start:109 stop:696 length:588 start_codon:yes stop_codon:yes gene_type:complete